MSLPTNELNELYRILEVNPVASLEEVERAYQDRLKKLDPSRFGNDKPRRLKAEEKRLEVINAYAKLRLELGQNGNAPATNPVVTMPAAAPSAAPASRSAGYHWSQSCKYVWIAGIVLAMTFLLVDSWYKYRGIIATTKMTVVSLPSPAPDPTSRTGYPGNQHVQVMPALGTDGYHWLMQTELMLDGEEGVRVRHTDYDGPPGGRDVHWSSSLHWLVTGLAYVDHLITHDPLTVSLERTEPWANTFVLGLMILILPIIIARRFGSIPAALLALTFVVVYPYYEFSFVGYLDHHGLAASSDLLMVLMMAAGGAGWLRNEAVDPNSLSPVERALWQWLPDRAQAKRWLIASGFFSGTGLWISSASIVPAMFGVGLGALLSTGWLARNPKENDVGRADPTLWRFWGIAAACSSIFFYLLEYAPFHFTMRLEVNHPLYALALIGAGDLLCRFSLALQTTGPARGFFEGCSTFINSIINQGKNILISAGIVLLLPFAVLVGGEHVFVIRPGFLLNLHNDYILEFRTFFVQMGFLSPMQIAGGISMIPLVLLPVFLLLSAPDLQKQWKAVVSVVFMPALVVMVLAFCQIRWLGINCALCCGGLAVAALVTTSPGSAFRWDISVRRLVAVLLLILVLIPFPLFTAAQWVSGGHFTPGVSELDLTQIVTRDVSQRLRYRLGNDRGVILSGPTTTTWMMYFGGFRGIGSLYWENVDGLRTAAAIYSATTDDEAKRLIDQNHVTHIAIYQWDAFAEEYARLGAGLRKPKDDRERQAQDSRLSQAFILKILTKHYLPHWLRPLPYRLPDHPWLKNSYIMLLEVVPEMSDAEFALRIGQWSLQSGSPNSLALAETEFNASLQAAAAQGQPDYLPALVAETQVYQARGQNDLFSLGVQRILGHLDQAPTMATEDRVELANVLFAANQTQKAAEQIATALAAADEKSLRHVGIDRLQVFLQIGAHLLGPNQSTPPNFDLATHLLPPPQQAQVLAERASALSSAHQTAKAVALYREVVKLSPEFEQATNVLARILATSSDPTLRNGNEALDLLHKVALAVHGQSADNLELLAYASATAGKFDDALFYASQAAQLDDNIPARAVLAVELRKKMDLFRNHQAFFEP